MAFPKIAIIGAGPAGCTLTRLLLSSSPPIHATIYEADPSFTSRTQGGTLDLHTSTGLAALKRCNLYDEFHKHARFDGEAIVICDKTVKKYVNMAGTTSEKDTRGRPEIDRGALRGLLIDSLPEGTIRWGSMVASIEESKRLGEGITANASRGIGVKMDIHLDNGSVERDYDLVIGADGAWSKVRPLITSVQPFFAGLGGADLYISDVEARYPDLYKFVNRGSVFASSDGKGISAQQKGDGSLVVYLSQTRTSREWKNEVSYDIHSPKEMKQGLLADFADWDPIFHKLIQAADENETIYARSLYMLPVDHRWDHRPGVTLLGDAAHLMTPFAGEGVNLAMEDAMRLADAIITSTSSTTKPKSESNSTSNMTESEDNQLQQQQQQQQKHQLDKNIQSFEENMFIRASKTAKHTFANMTDVFFTPGAPRSTIERYITRAEWTGVGQAESGENKEDIESGVSLDGKI